MTNAVADRVDKFTGLYSNHALVNDGRNDGGRGKYIHIRGRTRDSVEKSQGLGEPTPTTFGTTLFSEVCTIHPSGNVLLSPLSVFKALALVEEGATIGSENCSQLKRVLGSSSTIERTEDEDNEDSDVQLIMASSVWGDRLKQSYVDAVMSEHSAEALPMPMRFTPIDEWIEDKTNGMIKGFLGDEKIPADIVALLVNAVYFKGQWTHEFNPRHTIDGEFVHRNNSMVPARFMAATHMMDVIKDSPALGGASAVVLDYGKQSSDGEPTEFTSLFILPASSDNDSMSDVVNGLKSQSISELLGDASFTGVHLELPRFRLKFGPTEFGPPSLKQALENMGMIDAFNISISNKFNEMSNNPTLFVGDVWHGAAMEVTEEGTEASGTTVVPIRGRSASLRLLFDRPFVVAVVHRSTGTPIFLGRVEEPELDF